ncbi:MAG: protein kinase domain-containing protein [Burkholderiales bacterium]|nr:bifunctional protein-serine/threonine kinase/phosphatase [Burkholderiales bacterium]MDQ3197301.1 bifunctional protein-serine/threonine kinase/phosphatase [Pseudomonadota bacterium]
MTRQFTETGIRDPKPAVTDPRFSIAAADFRSSFLAVTFGHATATGKRPRNEDSFGAVTPEGDALFSKGMSFAVADGVSGNGGGREAADHVVRGMLTDYYATPDTWEIPWALNKVLVAVNRWLLSQSRSHRELAGMASTLSMLTLRGRRYWITHVGDTRIYRWRGARLAQLTTDHVWDRPDMQHVLRRAVGLDEHLAADISDGEIERHDVFLIASDGVWQPLGDRRIAELLAQRAEPAVAAEAIVHAALENGGHDNATAVVLRVDALPAGDRRDLVAAGLALHPPDRLKPGARIDNLVVDAVLHDSRETLLYRVTHAENRRKLVLKTLQPQLRNDAEARDALLSEEWLARRLVDPHFAQVPPAEPRSFLYYLMAYHEGATLQQHLNHGRHFSIPEAVQIGVHLCNGLSVLHRLHVVHRDIKPANLHLGVDARLRILDVGVAANPASGNSAGNPGTPSYMAPELYAGEPATSQSDLYAAGVTLYEILTRKYPYGEIEPFQHPRFGNPLSPGRVRPDLPQWLENILLKAVARDRRQRFETAEEFLLALENGERVRVVPPLRTPLVTSNPEALWQGIAAAAIAINLLLVYLILVS